MALRAKKPEGATKRAKILLWSEAGVGKTFALSHLPRNYIIDTENGTDYYGDIITQAGGVVMKSVDGHEVINEVRSLISEKHDYLTMSVDSITAVCNDLLAKEEDRQAALPNPNTYAPYNYLARMMRRLVNLCMQLDMNVVFTCHAKNEYDGRMTRVGLKLDGWNKLDYMFDLVLQLERRGKDRRIATVKKTRVNTFKDGETFEWSYEELKRRYGADILEAQAKVLKLATADQVQQLMALIHTAGVSQELADKWLTAAGVDCFADMPEEKIAKCIDWCDKQMKTMKEANC